MTTAVEILEWNRVRQGTATKRAIRFVFFLADDEGTIDPDGMRFVAHDPREHTWSSLRHALVLIGCEPHDDE